MVVQAGGRLLQGPGPLHARDERGGRTIVHGVEGERQANARLGLTISFPVSEHHSVKLHGSTGIYTRSGTDFDTLGVAWQVRWGAGR